MATNYLSLRSSALPALTATTMAISTLTGSTMRSNVITASSFTASSITTATILGTTILGQNPSYPNRYVELGTDAANSMYLDFHSSDSALPDYSTRIQSLGGATTGTGALNMTASTIGLVASNGVGIGTTSPQTALHVVGTVTANTFSAPTGNYLNLTNGAGAGSIALQGTNISIQNSYVGIGTATPSDSLVVNSGNIVLNNSAASAGGYLFNQNSVWGGVDVEGLSNTGAQTVNFGINMNRSKTWSSSYIGNWFRVDTRTSFNYSGFHFFTKAATSGTETEIMTILSNGYVGIGAVNPAQTLDVNGTIARNGFKLPRVDYGTFTTGTTVSVPILFNDTQYSHVEIRIHYLVSAQCNITMSALDANPTPASMNFQECSLTTYQWNAQAATYYDKNATDIQTSFNFANNVETAGIDNIAVIRIVRATGGTTTGLRNHYMYDNIYCIYGVGTARGYGMGHINCNGLGGYALAGFRLNASTGNISGNYTTTHYN